MTHAVALSRRTSLWLLGSFALAAGWLPQLAAAGYVQSNLASNIPGLAANFDANLQNPWGLAASPTSPFWVSDNGANVSTLYNAAGVPQPPTPLIVSVPPAPTGVVFNSTPSFALTNGNGNKATFIFDTENGTIAGWNGGTTAVTQVTNNGAVYKGITIGTNAGADFLFASNFAAGTIDVFDTKFAQVHISGAFTDPALPAGYAPFNVENLGGLLYVTYAVQDPDKHDDVPGLGNGLVDIFDTNGNFIGRFASNGKLDSPWGLVLAPANFGEFSNDLLVGNFGDGRINAFNPITGTFLGQLTSPDGTPIDIDGLWALKTHNPTANGFDGNSVYFTAGLNGEADGLFGRLSVPEPGSLALLGVAVMALALIRRRTR